MEADEKCKGFSILSDPKNDSQQIMKWRGHYDILLEAFIVFYQSELSKFPFVSHTATLIANGEENDLMINEAIQVDVASIEEMANANKNKYGWILTDSRWKNISHLADTVAADLSIAIDMFHTGWMDAVKEFNRIKDMAEEDYSLGDLEKDFNNVITAVLTNSPITAPKGDDPDNYTPSEIVYVGLMNVIHYLQQDASAPDKEVTHRAIQMLTWLERIKCVYPLAVHHFFLPQQKQLKGI